ncbi:hypothetical protein AB685_15615 [Bacillus sp. LL01]|nr:hypothetical protein AB685_15615 [Bacillus sp. LL01]
MKYKMIPPFKKACKTPPNTEKGEFFFIINHFNLYKSEYSYKNGIKIQIMCIRREQSTQNLSKRRNYITGGAQPKYR